MEEEKQIHKGAIQKPEEEKMFEEKPKKIRRRRRLIKKTKREEKYRWIEVIPPSIPSKVARE